MKSTENSTVDEYGEETVVTPRFGREETQTAQAVVPLAVPREANGRRSFTTLRRGSWPLALVLISTLIGGVLGGVGFYFYQKSQQAEAASTLSGSAQEVVAAPTEEVLPSPTPSVAEAFEAAAPDVATRDAGETLNPDAENPDAEPDSDRDVARSKESEPVRARRDEPRPPIRHGKKGARDDEETIGEQRPRRVRRNPEDIANDDEPEDQDREARRVGSISYPRGTRAERNAERRARRQAATDRIRGIFEGQPD